MKEVIHEMYSKEQIDQMVTEIATRINKDYEGKQIHMICILRGSVFFCADLAKKITQCRFLWILGSIQAMEMRSKVPDQ